jgi:hypothetical protein
MRTAFVVMLVTMVPAMARAEQAESRPRRVTAHAEVGLLLPLNDGLAARPNSTPGLASVGVGVGLDVRPSLDVEATVSATGPSSRLTRDGDVAIDNGTLVRVVARWHQNEVGFTPFVGGGPALDTGGTFGTVALLHLEAGFEVRASGGFYFVAAFQAVEPLMTSRPDVPPTQCQTLDCPSRFSPWSPIFGGRLGLGFRFG